MGCKTAERSCSPEGGDYGETYLTNSDAVVSLKATIKASDTAVILGIATFGESFKHADTFNMYVQTGASSWYHLAF